MTKVPKHTTILVLDPASSTGYCLVSISLEGLYANIYEYGHLDVDLSSEFQGDHCISLREQVRELIERHEVTEIAIEAYFFSKRFASGSSVNAAFRTTLHILARDLGLPYTVLGISEWKKFIAGRVNPTPAQKKQWGKDRAKKIFIQEALWQKYGIRFPNHSLSQKTGKPVSLRLDVIDVVAQAIYYVGIFKHVFDVVCTQEVAKDVKVRGKEGFIYPKKDKRKVF